MRRLSECAIPRTMKCSRCGEEFINDLFADLVLCPNSDCRAEGYFLWHLPIRAAEQIAENTKRAADILDEIKAAAN